MELQTAKEILAEIFRARSGNEDMIQSRLAERICAKSAPGRRHSPADRSYWQDPRERVAMRRRAGQEPMMKSGLDALLQQNSARTIDFMERSIELARMKTPYFIVGRLNSASFGKSSPGAKDTIFFIDLKLLKISQASGNIRIGFLS